MMMPHDLDSISRTDWAVAVMKEELPGFPGLTQFKRAAQLPIVVARHDDRLAKLPNPLEQPFCFDRCGPIVHEIAQNDKLLGLYSVTNSSSRS